MSSCCERVRRTACSGNNGESIADRPNIVIFRGTPIMVSPVATRERSSRCAVPKLICSPVPQTQGPRMEHRLGIRAPLALPVRLERGGRTLAFGRVLNASVSGAYVETSLAVQLLAPLEVVCGRTGTAPVAAYVTRVTATGIAVEWYEFAPAAIRRLLLHADAAGNGSGPSREDRGSSRSSTPVRAPCRGRRLDAPGQG